MYRSKPRQEEIDRKLGYKICSKCMTQQTLDNFLYQKTKHYFVAICNPCRRERTRNSRRTGPKIIPIFKTHETNGFIKCNNCHETKNIDKFRFRIINSKYPVYLTHCKECESVKKKSYNINIENERVTRKKWNRANRQDGKVRIDERMGGSIWECLKGAKGGRKWLDLVGYTLEQFLSHMESNLVEGMTWNNYGKIWHVHYILPKSLFKYTDNYSKEFKICWSLENLKPKFSIENCYERDLLDNGKLASSLSETERLDYLRNKGFSL